MHRRLKALFMLAAILAVTSTSMIHSSAAASSSVEYTDVANSAEPPPVADTVLGVYAAVGCGLFGRALGAGMVHPAVIAGTIASCGYMLLDALFL